jgi:hypothetical protein
MHSLAFALLLTVLPTPPLAINVEVQPSFMDSYMLLTRQTPCTYTCSTLAAGDHAETRVVVQRNGAIVTEQHSSTALMKPPSVGGR